MDDPGAAEAALAEEALGFKPQRWLVYIKKKMDRPILWLMTENLLTWRPLSLWSMALVEWLEPETTLCLVEREGQPDDLCDELRQLIGRAYNLIRWPYNQDFLEARRDLYDDVVLFEKNLFRHGAKNRTNKKYLQMFTLVVRDLNHPFDKENEFRWIELGEYYNELSECVEDIVGDGRREEEMHDDIEKVRRWFVKEAVRVLEAEGVAP